MSTAADLGEPLPAWRMPSHAFRACLFWQSLSLAAEPRSPVDDAFGTSPTCGLPTNPTLTTSYHER